MHYRRQDCWRRRAAAPLLIWGLLLGLIAAFQTASPANSRQAPMPHTVQAEYSSGAAASRETREVVAWIRASGDNRGLPFVIIDKLQAEVYVFTGRGLLRAASPALLGVARGDDSTPGIGDWKLSAIPPEERTTPAGRFVAALGNDLGPKNVLWIDYDAAISMHRVVRGNAGDNRLQRLKTPSVSDKRISYGCINVPVRFFDKIIEPSFKSTNGIVYILPETKSVSEVFGWNAD